MIRTMRKAMGPVARRVENMVAIGVVNLLKDAAGLQLLQVELLSDEVQDGVERFQDYGVSSRPKPGAEGVFLAVMGNRGGGVMIAVGDRRYRLQGLAEGEVALHDDQGQVVHLKRDGILLQSPLKVVVEAPQVTISCEAIDLGGEGGAGVARIGDAVAGGVITGGSTKVKAL